MTAPELPPPRSRKSLIALLVFLAVAGAAGAAGFAWWRHSSRFEETDDAFVDASIVGVSPQISGRIAAVHVKDNQDVKAGDLLVEIEPTDCVNAVNQATAALQAAQARVETARAAVDLVKATSDASLVQAQAALEAAQAGVEEAQAGQERAQAGIEQAKATVQWAEAQVDSAGAEVDAARAEATRREADMKRYDEIDPRAMSQQLREAARAAADSAAAQFSSAQKHKVAAEAQVAQERSRKSAAEAGLGEARAAVTKAKSRVAEAGGTLQAAKTAPQQISAAEAEVKTAQAGVDQAQASLEVARQQLLYTRVVAPVSGRITRKSVQPGQVVEPGRLLLMIVQPEVWVTANFKETQLSRMHVGQVVEIRVDSYPDRVLMGKIDSFQSGTGARFSLMPPENATGNYVKVVQRIPVKIVFDEEVGTRQLLGPGMSAVPRVRIAGDEGVPAPIGRPDAR